MQIVKNYLRIGLTLLTLMVIARLGNFVVGQLDGTAVTSQEMAAYGLSVLKQLATPSQIAAIALAFLIAISAKLGVEALEVSWLRYLRKKAGMQRDELGFGDYIRRSPYRMAVYMLDGSVYVIGFLALGLCYKALNPETHFGLPELLSLVARYASNLFASGWLIIAALAGYAIFSVLIGEILGSVLGIDKFGETARSDEAVLESASE